MNSWILGGATLCALTTSVAFASTASAQSAMLEGRSRSHESPQNFALELRFAPYTPDVDRAPDVTGGPYKQTFGTVPHLLAAVELDWQALRIPHFGTVGPGVSVGYVSMSRNAVLVTNDPKTTETENSGDETTLEIFPYYAVGVLRVDALTRDLHIPLVPYAKFGVGYARWRASDPDGTSVAKGAADSQSVRAVGATWGTQLALGISLDLNVFDPYSARTFDNTMGVNRTLLFFEYMNATLHGIGQAHPLWLGASTWATGITFEF